jgi:selenide,water dikinase
MTMLNRQASEILRPLEPNAVTDVTGFGLLGHAFEIAQRSEVGIRIDATAVPALSGALELAEAGVRTGGDRRNRSYVGDALTVEGAGEAQLALAFDPQTAGGLLIALPPERSRDLEHTMRLNGHFLAHIGRAVDSEGVVFVG